MIVIIGGMYRSGSTFTFNVARELLLKDGTVETHTWPKDQDSSSIYKQSVSKHIIVKTHDPDELTYALIKQDTAKCICTLRKPEDAIASHRRVFNVTVTEGAKLAKEWFDWYLPIKKNALNINYQVIDKFPLIAIFRIQWYLFKKINLITAFSIFNQYRKKKLKEKFDRLKLTDDTFDYGFSYADKTTFFHRKHISSIKSLPAHDLISKEEIKIIRSVLSSLLDDDGNLKINNYKPSNIVDKAEAKAQEAEAKAQEAEAKAQEAEAKAQEAEAKAQEAEAKAQEAEAKVQEAEAKAQEAEAKAQEAEAKAQEAEAKAQEAEAKAQEVDDSNKQLVAAVSQMRLSEENLTNTNIKLLKTTDALNLANQHIAEIHASSSWKLSKPLRLIGDLVKPSIHSCRNVGHFLPNTRRWFKTTLIKTLKKVGEAALKNAWVKNKALGYLYRRPALKAKLRFLILAQNFSSPSTITAAPPIDKNAIELELSTPALLVKKQNQNAINANHKTPLESYYY